MNSKILQNALILIGLCSTGAVTAHHSAGVIFQMDKEIAIEGVVSRFQMGNPHARIYLDVDSNGVTESWLAEGGSRTVLLRTGWNGNELQPGDVIEIVGNPSRDGSNVIHWKSLVLPDGRELYGEDLNPDLIEAARARRR